MTINELVQREAHREKVRHLSRIMADAMAKRGTHIMLNGARQTIQIPAKSLEVAAETAIDYCLNCLVVGIISGMQEGRKDIASRDTAARLEVRIRRSGLLRPQNKKEGAK